MAAVAKPAGAVGTRVAANLRRIRTQVPLSTYQLADRLTEIGWKINPDGITRIETGDRRTTVDDVVALAVALGVSPSRLLMAAVEGDTEVAVVGNVTAGIWDLSAWICGDKPLEPATGPEVALFSAQNQPHRWKDVYGELTTAMRAALNAGIPPEVLRDCVGRMA